jgi:hypothetical protein
LRSLAIILFLLVISSCSVLRRGSNDTIIADDEKSFFNAYEHILQQNITTQDFYISKAEIDIISGEDKQSFICSFKFLFPDKYVISLRSKSGIEGARIFLTRDTLIVNDRINRKLYYGTPDYIKRKYGIASTLFPVIFGDLCFKEIIEPENTECQNGYINITGSAMGSRFEAIADCRKAKLISLVQFGDQNVEQVRIAYAKFFAAGSILVPSSITLINKDIRIVMKIRKLEIPWEGNFSFVPGNKYELIPLK